MDDDNAAFLDGELDSVDNLPEPVRQFYKKHDDGKFRPNVRPVNGWGFENVGGLKSTLGKLKESDRQLKELQGRFSDLDPDAAREAMAKLEELRNAVPEDKVKDKLSSLEAQLRKKHEAELAEARKQADTYKGLVDTHVTDAEALAAISENEGIPKILLPIIKPHLRPVVEDGKVVVRVMDETGTPRITQKQGKDGYMSVSEFVASLKEDRDYMVAFKGRDATGSGAGNAGNRNGSSHIPDNVTGQQRLAMLRRMGK